MKKINKDKTENMSLYIGCSRWHYPFLKKYFYKGVSQKSRFKVYSKLSIHVR